MSEQHEWHPSERTQKRIEEIQRNLSESGQNPLNIAVEPIVAQQTEPTIVTVENNAPQNEEEQKRKKQIANDLDLVLAKVPNEIRSDNFKYYENRQKAAEANNRLKEQKIYIDAYTREDIQVGGEERNKILGSRKSILREIVDKARNGEQLTDEENRVVSKINLKTEDLAVESVEQTPVSIVPPVEMQPVITPVAVAEQTEPVQIEDTNIEQKRQTLAELKAALVVIDPGADHETSVRLSKERAEAEKRLEEKGIDLNKFVGADLPIESLDDVKQLTNRRKTMIEILDKMARGDVLSPYEEGLLKRVKIEKDNLSFQEPVVDPTPTPTADPTPVNADSRRFTVQNQRAGGSNNSGVNNQEELERIIQSYKEIEDLAKRQRQLSSLADKLLREGKIEFGNIAIREANALQRESIIGLPEDDDPATVRKWARARMSGLLYAPSAARAAGKNPNNIFDVINETAFGGKINVNGLNYIDGRIRDEVAGAINKDGSVKEAGEINVVNEISSIYTEWSNAHIKIDKMVDAFENKAGYFGVPTNKINENLLNGLKGEGSVKNENGVESDPNGGSREIAHALRIYWAMAHNKEDEGKRILRDEELDGLQSIFNSQLSVEGVQDIRNLIADKCGGVFYESIGLMYAGFWGISAYGSDSILPGIKNADGMGLLIHTELNKYSNEKDRLNSGKRTYRFMSDEVANVGIEYQGGRPVLENGQYKTVEFSVHPGTFQNQVDAKEPKTFYILRPAGSNEPYKIVKKIGDSNFDYAIDTGPDVTRYELNRSKYEEVSFDQIIKEGKVHEIDWKDSLDLAGLMVFRERRAVSLYKTFKRLDDDIAKLTEVELIARKEVFEEATPQCNIETQQHLGFIWLYSLIAKNRAFWTGDQKRDELKRMVDNAVKTKLISEKNADDLRNQFNLKWTTDAGKLMDNTYSAKNIYKSVFGNIDFRSMARSLVDRILGRRR